MNFSFKPSRLTHLLQGSLTSANMVKGAKEQPEAGRGLPPTSPGRIQVLGDGQVADNASKQPVAGQANRGEMADNRYRSSKEVMDSFLQKGAAEAANLVTTPKRTREGQPSPKERPEGKKGRVGGEESGSGSDMDQMEDAQDKTPEARKSMEGGWEKEIRGRLEKEINDAQQSGRPIQVDNIMGAIRETVAALLEQATKGAVKEAGRQSHQIYKDNQEAQKCRKSILIHNADKWVQGILPDYSLGERVTALIHGVTNGMVSVADAFAIGKGREGKGPPTSALVTFGSITQKGTFFRVIATEVRRGSTCGEKFKLISCRDAFPKGKINDAKRLVQKGIALRKNGQVAYFRVVASGEGCIPVLEVKHYLGNGQISGRWEVFASQERQPPAVAQPMGPAHRGGGGQGGNAPLGGSRGGGGGGYVKRGGGTGGTKRGGGEWYTVGRGGRTLVPPAGRIRTPHKTRTEERPLSMPSSPDFHNTAFPHFEDDEGFQRAFDEEELFYNEEY
jgi:hypothetical protein